MIETVGANLRDGRPSVAAASFVADCNDQWGQLGKFLQIR